MKNFFWLVAISSAVILALSGCDRNSSPVASNEPTVSATATQPTHTPPSHNNYSVEWVRNDIPPTMSAGVPATIHVTAKNTGDWAWPDPATANPSNPNGTYAVCLTYRWAESKAGESTRGQLTASVAPGETTDFTITITPLKEPGLHYIHLNLIVELGVSFSDKGVADLIVPVTVQ